MQTKEQIAIRDNLKAVVSGLYDLQKLRIQTGNRYIINKKAKLGQVAKVKEGALTTEAKDLLKKVRASYNLMSEGMTLLTEKEFDKAKVPKGKGVFDDYTEMCLAAMHTSVHQQEQAQVKQLESILVKFPIYTEYLTTVRGVGPLMAAVIIAGLDPYKAKYPSSFIMYVGGDVAGDGAGRSKRSEHLVDVTYKTRDGKTKTKKSITYNAWLKTKLFGVLAPSFVKQPAEKSKFRTIYQDYKHRITNHKNHKDKSKGHIDAMAKRYIIKQFLVELHMTWRALEGLEVSEPYEVAKLGYSHGRDPSAEAAASKAA